MCCTAVKFAPSIFPAGMTLANMGLTLGLIPFAARLADKGLPKLAATMGVLVVAAVCSIPMVLAVSSQSMVAAWLMQVRVRPAGRHSAQNHALFTVTKWERDMGWKYAASCRSVLSFRRCWDRYTLEYRGFCPPLGLLTVGNQSLLW